MGCNCQKDSGVAYLVTRPDRTTQTYSLLPLAQAEIRKVGGGSVRAVKATKQS